VGARVVLVQQTHIVVALQCCLYVAADSAASDVGRCDLVLQSANTSSLEQGVRVITGDVCCCCVIEEWGVMLGAVRCALSLIEVEQGAEVSHNSTRRLRTSLLLTQSALTL